MLLGVTFFPVKIGFAFDFAHGDTGRQTSPSAGDALAECGISGAAYIYSDVRI